MPSALLLSFLIAGCTAAEQPEAAESVEAEPAVSLEDTDWVLVELNGQSVETTGRLRAPSLRFDSGMGVVAGNSGVNQYSGGYSLEGESIEFGPMRTTMMAGPPEAMEMESGFLKALNAMSGWQIEEGRLSLLEGDTVLARFAVTPPVAAVTGTVFYRERMALTPDALLEVVLEDVSRADAPAGILSVYRKANPGNPPLAFALEYDPQAIDERKTYAVRARITVGDRLIFSSDTIQPVITRDHGTEVEILVRRVKSADE